MKFIPLPLFGFENIHFTNDPAGGFVLVPHGCCGPVYLMLFTGSVIVISAESTLTHTKQTADSRQQTADSRQQTFSFQAPPSKIPDDQQTSSWNQEPRAANEDTDCGLAVNGGWRE